MVPFSQVSKEKTCKGSKQRSDDILPVVKFQSRKRVLAQGPPTDRETRSKQAKLRLMQFWVHHPGIMMTLKLLWKVSSLTMLLILNLDLTVWWLQAYLFTFFRFRGGPTWWQQPHNQWRWCHVSWTWWRQLDDHWRWVFSFTCHIAYCLLVWWKDSYCVQF
jgi:hypothetical protein